MKFNFFLKKKNKFLFEAKRLARIRYNHDVEYYSNSPLVRMDDLPNVHQGSLYFISDLLYRRLMRRYGDKKIYINKLKNGYGKVIIT